MVFFGVFLVMAVSVGGVKFGKTYFLIYLFIYLFIYFLGGNI